ncbi:N-acetyl-1-D-myo-inositol-2-amino-2-deoxy-alpha-D-glucopyranoside deacetylase [Streptomyces flaveus]|uniref:N-acetyl-1-D-myo-inositol-2-amino-2-deoxy-alpha- D-glucopyranoside deacetylase n=1 Tax=Streptomyces flaveus TaxID=66370 RepID=UPI0033305892
MNKPSRRILFVHAHPDDESLGNAATMAKYIAEGVEVSLVTCTLGEGGPIIPPELEHLGSRRDDTLGRHRAEELAAAMRQIGVTDHRFLGGAGRYRDSGKMGSSQNERPNCFWQADVDVAAGYLAEVIREIRPHVVVTYDENGGYGHPDHIQAHRVTMRAITLASNAGFGKSEPHQVAKVYRNCLPRSLVESSLRQLQESSGAARHGRIATVEYIPGVIDDDLVTSAIDGRQYAMQKAAAMRAHATQIVVDWPYFTLSDGVVQPVYATEYYQLLQSAVGDRVTGGIWEDDLFTGL